MVLTFSMCVHTFFFLLYDMIFAPPPPLITFCPRLRKGGDVRGAVYVLYSVGFFATLYLSLCTATFHKGISKNLRRTRAVSVKGKSYTATSRFQIHLVFISNWYCVYFGMYFVYTPRFRIGLQLKYSISIFNVSLLLPSFYVLFTIWRLNSTSSHIVFASPTFSCEGTRLPV